MPGTMQGEKSRLGLIALILIALIVPLGIGTAVCGVILFAVRGLPEAPGTTQDRWSQSVLSRLILESSLEWTPGGEHIVLGIALNDVEDGEAYQVRTDGSNIKRISKEEDDRYLVEVGHDISPDGKRVVYVTSRHQRGRGTDIETSKLDGSDRRRLTRDGIVSGAPQWSPDGTPIAYVDGDIEIIHADGTRKSTIRFPGDIGPHAGRGPIWSPDGQTIVFVARTKEFYADSKKGAVLYTVNVDGTGRQEAFATPFPNSWTRPISRPSWSPDGQYLAFALYFDESDIHDENGVYVVKPDGTGLRRLVAWPEQVESVDWSPDGEEILTGNGLIVKIVDGDTRRVLPLGLSKRTVWSPDGSQMAVLTRGGQLIVANRDGSDRRNLTP